MEKIEFIVTEKAGVFVAGQRSPGTGKPIQLTAEQAHHALEAGELSKKPTETSGSKKPAKPGEA